MHHSRPGRRGVGQLGGAAGNLISPRWPRLPRALHYRKERPWAQQSAVARILREPTPSGIFRRGHALRVPPGTLPPPSAAAETLHYLQGTSLGSAHRCGSHCPRANALLALSAEVSLTCEPPGTLSPSSDLPLRTRATGERPWAQEFSAVARTTSEPSPTGQGAPLKTGLLGRPVSKTQCPMDLRPPQQPKPPRYRASR